MRLVHLAKMRITSNLTQAPLRPSPWRGEANKVPL